MSLTAGIRSGLRGSVLSGLNPGAVAVRPTITTTLLTSGSSSTDGTSFSTASVTPTANALVLLCMQTNGTTPSAPTVTGNGLTWVEVVNSGAFSTSNARRNVIYRALGASPTPGAITMNFGADTQASVIWDVIQLVNADATGTNGSGAIVQAPAYLGGASGTTLSRNLNAFEHANNVHVAVVGLNAANAVTHDPDFAELSDDTVGSGAQALCSMWAANTRACDPSWSTAIGVMANLEIKAKG